MAPKLLTLVRHGEAEHNIDRRHHLPDTHLTTRGESQCQTLCQRFPTSPAIDLLVSSPLRRTLETTLIGFAPQAAALGIEVVPELQECSAMPCDTGSAVEVLQADERFRGIDFSRCVDGWNSNQGIWGADSAALKERARLARNWLKGRDEPHVVAVLHGAVSTVLSVCFFFFA